MITTLRFYANGMWIEEMVGDMKNRGIDLELTRFHHVQHLSRIRLIVCLLDVCQFALGEQVVSHGLGQLIDRNDRRDLIIFVNNWLEDNDC